MVSARICEMVRVRVRARVLIRMLIDAGKS